MLGDMKILQDGLKQALVRLEETGVRHSWLVPYIHIANQYVHEAEFNVNQLKNSKLAAKI